MRRTWMVWLLAVVVAGATASVAFAGNVHFKNGGGPNAVVSGTTLTVSGTLVGLGVSPGTITLDAFGTLSTTCQNPGTNEKIVTPHSGSGPIASGTVAINPDAIDKSGNYTFTVSATATGGSCPNGHWTKTVTVTYTSYTLTVTQGSNVTTLGPYNVV
jgi:hypothetical protein